MATQETSGKAASDMSPSDTGHPPGEGSVPAIGQGAGRENILRVRAGLLLVVALLLFCVGGGTFVARQFNLGFWWAMLIALVFAIGVGVLVARLTNKTYLIIAAIVTALTTYLAYDFMRGSLEWGVPAAGLLALVPLALMVAAFWDFRRLKSEVQRWADSR